LPWIGQEIPIFMPQANFPAVMRRSDQCNSYIEQRLQLQGKS
jgi:hypothetical protein